MACVNCGKIRSAILHGKMAEAVGLSVDALREKIGFKVEHTAAEPAAPSLPSLSGKNKTELLEIAATEVVDVPEGATNAQIIEAIEQHRQGLVEP